MLQHIGLHDVFDGPRVSRLINYHVESGRRFCHTIQSAQTWQSGTIIPVNEKLAYKNYDQN